MKYQDVNEKSIPAGISSITEDAVAMSNQIGDLMKEKCEINPRVNAFMLGFPKDDIINFDAGEKAEALSGKPWQSDLITYKKDADGNVIKAAPDAAYPAEIALAKKETALLDESTAYGSSVMFQKDEHGNLVKIAKESRYWSSTYSKSHQDLV